MNNLSIHHFYLFTFFLFCNFAVPLMADDIHRTVLSVLEKGHFWEQLWINFQNWTGRMSAQALVYLFFNRGFNGISLPILNIINSILWVYLFDRFYFFIQKLQKTEDNKNFGIFVFFFLIFLHYTNFASNILWKTVALQYFWGFCLWIYWIDRVFFKQKNILIIGFGIGFLLGLYNELFAFHLLSMAGLIFIFFRKHSIPTLFWKNGFSFALGVLIGFVLFLAAPGNFKRLEVQEKASIGLWDLFIEKISVADFAVVFCLSIVTIFIVSYLAFRANKKIEKKLLSVLILFHLSAFIIILMVNLKIGWMATRIFYFWGLIVFFGFYFYIHPLIQRIPIFWASKVNYFCTSVSLILLFLMSYAYWDLARFQIQREQLIAQALAQNQKEISLPVYKPIRNLSRFMLFYDITKNTEDWKNIALAQYYGLEKVIAVEE